jgi:hypothetical protein
VGKHRQISGAPSRASAPHASGCTSRARLEAPLTGVCNTPAIFSPIGRRVGGVFIRFRTAAKGTTAPSPSPAWSPGRRGRAPLAAAPISSGEGIFHPTNCDSQFPQTRKPSQARRILSHPKQRLGWGREGGFLSANTLLRPKRQSNSMKKSVANGCTRTELLYKIPSLAFPSPGCVLGKARRKDCVSSSVVVNSNGSLAVFPIQRMKY